MFNRVEAGRGASSLGIIVAVLVATAAVTPAAAAPTSGGPAARSAVDNGSTGKGPVRTSPAVPTAAELAASARSAMPAAARPGGDELMDHTARRLVPCDDDPAFLCGTLPVPLDRRTPDGRFVNLHVEVFPHTGPQRKADGAVFVTGGGPGESATLSLKYGMAFFVLSAVAETRDLVFIDQRGVGLSDVIDCPALQNGGPLYLSSAACRNQLGDTANFYSTTDVADDLEDVRRAFGYQQIDLVGGSYAGADMITYAQRHTERVRSVAIASPAVVVGSDPFYSDTPLAMPGIVDGVCGRSPACAAAIPDPAGTFAQLAQRLRNDPVSGVGIDSAGVGHDITVTETLLANAIMYLEGAHFTGPGEITQAAVALSKGDPVPLLRLAADVDPMDAFGDDLREFSAGHNLARGCVDAELPFDRDAAPGVRATQYAAAYEAEPAFYGPIAKESFLAPGYRGFQPSPCIASSWEDRPMYPAGAQVHGVPTLVLGGDYDLVVPESVSQLVTDVLVDASYVTVTATGHNPWFWSDCGPELVQRFIAQLAVGDTSCADVPAAGWWVPGSFPTGVADAPPAAQTAGPPASLSLRRLATVAAWTMMDSVQHNFYVAGDSVALRGGVVDYEYVGDANTWTLEQAHFTEDVALSGTARQLESGYDGEFTVTGPGHRATTMRINGEFFRYGADMTITVDVGGQAVTFAVPAY